MPKVGRNAPCPCGSGLKYKRCCEGKELAAEAAELLGSLDAGEQAEILVWDRVYRSILHGVWTAFHSDTGTPPTVEEMEEFYRDAYGYEVDDALIDELVFPLSPQACAQIVAVNDLKDEKIVEVASEETQPTGTQPDLFPKPPPAE